MMPSETFEADRLRRLEARIAELPTDPAALLKLLEERHLLELTAWENCAEFVALRRRLTSETERGCPHAMHGLPVCRFHFEAEERGEVKRK